MPPADNQQNVNPSFNPAQNATQPGVSDPVSPADPLVATPTPTGASFDQTVAPAFPQVPDAGQPSTSAGAATPQFGNPTDAPSFGSTPTPAAPADYGAGAMPQQTPDFSAPAAPASPAFPSPADSTLPPAPQQ